MRNKIENMLLKIEKSIPIEVSIAGMVICSVIAGMCIGYLYAIHGN